MRTKLIWITVFIAMMVVGCGNNTKTIEGTVQTKGSGNEAGTQVESKLEKTVENTAEQSEEEVVEYKGYAFIYNDVAIEMDAEAGGIVDALGEADFYFEAPSCAFEGIDKMYTYKGFELDTYPTEDKDYVSSVVFKDDTVTTMEGVGLGDSVERLEEVYGTQWTDENGMMVYEKDGMKLCFILEDGTVVSVEYRSKVMEG